MSKIFDWIRDIPNLSRREKEAYKAFHVFVIVSYFFWVRSAFFPFVGGAALLVDRGVKFFFVIAFIWFIVKALSANVLSRVWNPCFNKRAYMMLFFVVYMLILGFYYNRGWTSTWSIISVGIYFITMTFVIAMGRGGDYFRCNWKLFLLFFYVTAILMIATQNIHITKFVAGTDIEGSIDEFRGTTSLAYSFRGVLQFSLFFFLLACLWRKRMTALYRGLLFFSIVPYAYFQIYIEKFRSHILLLGLVMIFGALYSLKSGKVKSLIVIALIGMLGVSVYFSKSFSQARERVSESTITAVDTGEAKNKLVAAFLGERGVEFECFWDTFPLINKIFGKGAKGSFDAYYWGRGDHWDTVHIGFFKMVLIGGVFLFVFYLGFFIKAFTRSVTSIEVNEGFLSACKALVIIIFIKNWVNPILVGDACFEYFIVWFALSGIWSPQSRMLMRKQIV